MAEIVQVVQEVIRKGQGFECQMCMIAWIPKNLAALTDEKKRPRRCPNHQCRSVRWDRDKYPNAAPPRPPTPPAPFSPDDGSQTNGNGDGLRTCYQTLPALARKPSTPVRISTIGSPHDAVSA